MTPTYRARVLLATAMLLGPLGMARAVVPGGIVSGSASVSADVDAASEMSATITVDEDPGEVAYFWATQFGIATKVDHGGYFGLQGNGLIGGKSIGKMLIFSVWNASSAQAAAGASAERFDGEGKGWSIRRAYAWREGVHYRFHVAKDGAHAWRASVRASTGETIALGRISIAEDAALSTQIVTFTEYFGGRESCDALPFAVATFSALTYGNEPAEFDETAPYGNCAQFGQASLPTPSSNVHRINGPDPASMRAVKHGEPKH